jgi:hypothetical protein
MELIYRTIDGKEFDNEADACYHENEVLGSQIVMFDDEGKRTKKADDAFAVCLAEEGAGEIFPNMTSDGAPGIGRNDWGIYFWDSFDCMYKYIPVEVYRAAKAAIEHAIDAGWAD